MENEDYYIVGNYEAESWLDKVGISIIIALAWIFFSFADLWKKIFQKRILEKQIAYLNSNAIREGDFYGLKEIPLKIMTENREQIKNHLRFLLWTNPEKIIYLVTLEIGKKEKVFLNEIISEVFSFSKQNLTVAALKVLSGNTSLWQKTQIITYMLQHLVKEKQTYFVDFFRETFQKMGDPIKKSVEKTIGYEI